MQTAGQQQVEKLKQDFVLLDADQDAHINKKQLENYMKENKIHNIPIWKVNQMMEHLNNKMSQEDFLIWIMGCKSGLQDLSATKFILFKQLNNFKSARPSSIEEKIKTSHLEFCVKKNTQQNKHFIKIKAGLDRKQSTIKKQELQQVLGRTPSQINCVFKIKTVNDGKLIAEKLSQIAQLGLALASELGPTATPFIQSINLTSKWHKQHVYLIIQLNHTFLNMLLKFIKQAIEELIPQGRSHLSAQIQSDFSQVLQPSFDPFAQSLKLQAQLLIGEALLLKFKEKLLEGFDKMNEKDKQGALYRFLFESANLSMEFSDIRECFKPLGFENIGHISESGQIRDQLKSLQISSIIKQFLPDGDQLLKLIKSNCRPQGSLSINISELSINLDFNFNIQDFFDIL